MKLHHKIIIILSSIFLVFVLVTGYKVYKIIKHAEVLTGKKESIPQPLNKVPPLSKNTADWPNWRGPNMNGKSDIKGINTDWTKCLNKLWEINYLCQGKANSTWSAPVIQGNRLIVTGRDDRNDLVFCIDPENGKLIWFKSYEAEAATSHGPGARATPFIDDNRVYTFGRSGDLACWMLYDGKLLWKKNVKDIGGNEPMWGYSTSPLVFDNKVIIQGGGKALVAAYDKMTGYIAWKSMEGDAGYAASVIMYINKVPKLLIFHAKSLSLLNPEDGKEFGSTPWPTKYGVNATTPLICNRNVFITSGYEMGGEVLEVNNNNFSVKWKNDVIASQHSDPVLIDGFLYGYSGQSNRNDGKFKCVEMSTGNEMWSTGEIGWGTIIYADGYLVCLDIKGNLYLVKPDPQKFLKMGEIKNALEGVTAPAWTCPVIANGKLYLRYLQRLVCYDLKK